ncbi:hypothetical protein, partial [Roseovarius sp. D0-M9]|uniref:hypothetical protein n=1 Tax=Roseovarius sp. D0-M9 TaxID=3127117 RepID=UPI00300FE783
RRSAQAPARVTLRHNIWCGRELTGDPHTHTNREEAIKNRLVHASDPSQQPDMQCDLYEMQKSCVVRPTVW